MNSTNKGNVIDNTTNIRLKIGLTPVDKAKLELLFNTDEQWRELVKRIVESAYNQAFSAGYQKGINENIDNDGEDWKKG